MVTSVPGGDAENDGWSLSVRGNVVSLLALLLLLLLPDGETGLPFSLFSVKVSGAMVEETGLGWMETNAHPFSVFSTRDDCAMVERIGSGLYTNE
jgi:hypothetical protein